jgi:hypothetical protein
MAAPDLNARGSQAREWRLLWKASEPTLVGGPCRGELEGGAPDLALRPARYRDGSRGLTRFSS